MRTAPRLLAVVLAAAVLAACGGDDEPVTAGDGSSAPPGQALAPHYVSTDITEGGGPRPLVPGTQIDLRFDETTVGASLGCNSMSGTYRLDGDVLVVDGGMAMAEMGCDPARHEQDQWFAELLTSRPRLAVDGDELTLTAGETVVRFVDRELAEPDRELVGTTWEVEGFADGQAPEDVAMSASSGQPGVLQLLDDGFVTGGDGCSGFGHGASDADEQVGLKYEIDGDRIHFAGNPPQTGMACPEDREEYTSRFWSALTGTVTWSIDADRLRLVGEDGRVVSFRATA